MDTRSPLENSPSAPQPTEQAGSARSRQTLGAERATFYEYLRAIRSTLPSLKLAAAVLRQGMERESHGAVSYPIELLRNVEAIVSQLIQQAERKE